MTKFNKSFFIANKSELLAGSLSWCKEEQRSGCAKHKRKVHADQRCGNTEHVGNQTDKGLARVSAPQLQTRLSASHNVG